MSKVARASFDIVYYKEVTIMKRKNIWTKNIALLLAFSLILGVGLENWVQAAGTATTIPAELKDYTRITMENFGLTASTDEAGTPCPNAEEGIYTGETLHKTYLDTRNKEDCYASSRMAKKGRIL